MNPVDDVMAVIRRHLDAFARGDVKALMDDYAETIVFLSPATGVIKGREAVSQLYDGLFRDALPSATTQISFGEILAEGEIGVVTWNAKNSTLRTEGAADTFVIRDGKIVGQTGVGAFVPEASG
jgi:ketosteroid isomerase-like protein